MAESGGGAAPAGERWLTVAQVAKRLGVSASFVHRRIEDRSLPAIRYLGSRVLRVRSSDVDAYLAASRVPRG